MSQGLDFCTTRVASCTNTSGRVICFTYFWTFISSLFVLLENKTCVACCYNLDSDMFSQWATTLTVFVNKEKNTENVKCWSQWGFFFLSKLWSSGIANQVPTETLILSCLFNIFPTSCRKPLGLEEVVLHPTAASVVHLTWLYKLWSQIKILRQAADKHGFV